MKRNDAIREVFRQNRALYYRYCILSAVLFISIVLLLLAYAFLL